MEQQPQNKPPSPIQQKLAAVRSLHDTQKIYIQEKLTTVRSMHDTQKLYIRTELEQVSGLIPMLMKHRNGEKWTQEERAVLLRDLRAMRNLSPYLIPLVMPGGVLLLPLFAWWLDNRRKRRERDAELAHTRPAPPENLSSGTRRE